MTSSHRSADRRPASRRNNSPGRPSPGAGEDFTRMAGARHVLPARRERKAHSPSVPAFRLSGALAAIPQRDLNGLYLSG